MAAPAIQRSPLFEGWPLLGVLSAGLFAMTIAVLATAGIEEEGVRMLIRATARSSVVLFCLAYSTAALVRFWPSDATRWLIRNRRYVGLGFAVSHAIHYAAVYAVSRIDPQQFFVEEGRELTGFVTVMTVVFLAALVALSFDTTQRWAGPKGWRSAHWLLCAAFWVFFLSAYGGRVAEGELFYAPFLALLIATMGLRVAAFGSRLWARRRTAVA